MPIFSEEKDKQLFAELKHLLRRGKFVLGGEHFPVLTELYNRLYNEVKLGENVCDGEGAA